MGLKVEELIANHDFKVHNTGHYTHVQHSGTTGTVRKSAIDLLLSRGIPSLTGWAVDILAPIQSDHLPCTAAFRLAKQMVSKRWNLNDMNWNCWEDQMELALCAWHNECGSDHNMDKLCESFTSRVMDCAEANIPKETVCRHSRPYFTHELKALQDKSRNARAKFKKRSDEHNLNVLNKARDEYTEAYTKAQINWWNKTLESVDQRNLWQTVNKITNSHCRSAVQPIRINGCDYAFDDKSICDRLEEVHIHRSHVQPGAFDEEWRVEVEREVDRLIQSETDNVNSPQYVTQSSYNRDISTAEVRNALTSMNINASPGPDGILPVMLAKAVSACTPYLKHLYNKCFRSGQIPQLWKRDNRVYLPKPAKSDYHVEKAYRPLSLNSVNGKCYEFIMCTRFVNHLITQFQIDKYNFAYAKYSSTVHGLLYMINSIKAVVYCMRTLFSSFA